MTDRYKGFIVTLDKDYRSDDSEAIITAIGMVKGVADVKPLVAEYNDHINRQRIKMEMTDKLWKVLQDDNK